MELRRIAYTARQRVETTFDGIKRFSKLERVLALVCILIPALLIIFDNGPIRPSISAYYDMEKNQVYYFSLTVASMLFIVNGIVKRKKIYNTILGIMLAGLILFNHEDACVLHFIFAAIFFSGNALVMVIYTPRKELWFKILLVLGIVISMLVFFIFKWGTLFFAEWLSFTIIAVHYVLESLGLIH